MERIIDQERYQTGFNDAYLVSTYEPELLNEFAPDAGVKDDYADGFYAGIEQYESNKEKEALQELDNLRAAERDLDRER